MRPVMLLVDDEPLLRMEIAELAEKEAFDVVEASNSAQARHIFEGRTDIRVVFTDIRMPGDMDGLELAHLIRKRWPPTTIVICSGNVRPRPEDMPTDAVFLSKPCASPSTAELLSDIREKVRVASIRTERVGGCMLSTTSQFRGALYIFCYPQCVQLGHGESAGGISFSLG